MPFEDEDLNKLETDPVCYMYSVYDTIRFKYTTNCYFTNTTGTEVCPKKYFVIVIKNIYIYHYNSYPMTQEQHLNTLLEEMMNLL